MTIGQTVERATCLNLWTEARPGQMWLSGSPTGWLGLTFREEISPTSGGCDRKGPARRSTGGSWVRKTCWAAPPWRSNGH